MASRFLVVPQWQGGTSARAMSLADGALAIRDDLPSSATTVIDVPVEAGEELGTGVKRYSALRRIGEAIALEATAAGPGVIVIGGDCGVAIPAIGVAAGRSAGLAVVWFDAHADLHSPESSPSGALGGMSLRAVLGEGADGIALTETAVAIDRVVLAGARAIDEAEQQLIDETPLTVIPRLDSAEAVLDALRAMDATDVYVHVDLDVLDPAEFAGLADPVPFGVALSTLTATISGIRAEFSVVGSSISGFSPASPEAAADDLSAILRIISALTR
ncbi:arginase family protein [Agromyces atrinae]|uniref:Arginase n=1 Tax=Agromyces atrinae TaxID=592376 RepID=A0A4Q2M7G6_9MICO|nr:arginase family protein [Agromyces atrinae]NYD66587.1 arginase [Agromyces atrinae]RXZ87257.1 arginase family protein [Agromyces atrinae]